LCFRYLQIHFILCLYFCIFSSNNFFIIYLGITINQYLFVTETTNEMFKSLITNEDEFYIKIFSKSQELTASSSLSNSMIMVFKLISHVGFKDSQLIYMNILNRSNLINNNNLKLIKQQQQQHQLVVVDKSCVPMIILSNEINFNNLFDLLNLISSIEFNNDNNKKRIEFLSTRIWEVMMLLSTNQNCLKLISYKLE
jgi:hypothetical protein